MARALADFKFIMLCVLVVAFEVWGDNINTSDAGQGRGFRFKVNEEGFHPVLISIHLNLDISRGIAHPALQVVLMSQPVNKGSEANPLYYPTYTNSHDHSHINEHHRGFSHEIVSGLI